MPALPEPLVGLVISYAYLWSEESKRGQVEGAKDRPCALIMALEPSEAGQRKEVAVVPITHSMPLDASAAIEMPPRVKEYLGLDSDRSWVILNEVNIFTWPGFDLRPIRKRGGRVDYGVLPPRFVDRLIAKFTELAEEGCVSQACRDEA